MDSLLALAEQSQLRDFLQSNDVLVFFGVVHQLRNGDGKTLQRGEPEDVLGVILGEVFADVALAFTQETAEVPLVGRLRVPCFQVRLPVTFSSSFLLRSLDYVQLELHVEIGAE